MRLDTFPNSTHHAAQVPFASVATAAVAAFVIIIDGSDHAALGNNEVIQAFVTALLQSTI